MDKPARLSPNETAVMDALADGLTVKEVAGDWDVSQTVVYRNIDRAKRKLGARTTFHAVAIWVAIPTQGLAAVRRRGGVSKNLAGSITGPCAQSMRAWPQVSAPNFGSD
jgi:DNA-binding CsgD family transcriptional regulator